MARRPRKSSEKYREDLVTKGALPEPVIRLLVRLNDLGLAGNFADGDAAWRVPPDEEDSPSLRCTHCKCGDKRAGEVGVCRQRLSAQLNGREDKLSPPAPQLVQAYVDLYVERSGADEDTTRVIQREINALYQAADRHAVEERRRRREKAAAEGRRDATATVRQQAREITELRDALTRRVEELARSQDQVHILSADLDQQIAQIAAVRTGITKLRRQLLEQEDKLQQLRAGEQRAHREAETYRAQALQLRAEADQLEGRVAELEARLAALTTSAARTTGVPVRQENQPDTGPKDRVLYRPPEWARLWKLVLAEGLAAVVTGVIWLAHPIEVTGAVTIGLCCGVLFGLFGLGGGESRFRITEHALRLNRRREYPWSEVGQLVRIGRFHAPSGTYMPGPATCPGCGKAQGPAVVGLEVRARDGALLAAINLDYIARPDCPDCNPRDYEGNRADGGFGPDSLPFLDREWPLVTELVTTLAPHVTITERDLEDFVHRSTARREV